MGSKVPRKTRKKRRKRGTLPLQKLHPDRLAKARKGKGNIFKLNPKTQTFLLKSLSQVLTLPRAKEPWRRCWAPQYKKVTCYPYEGSLGSGCVAQLSNLAVAPQDCCEVSVRACIVPSVLPVLKNNYNGKPRHKVKHRLK